jgi:hypothetical protein
MTVVFGTPGSIIHSFVKSAKEKSRMGQDEKENMSALLDGRVRRGYSGWFDVKLIVKVLRQNVPAFFSPDKAIQ